MYYSAAPFSISISSSRAALVRTRRRLPLIGATLRRSFPAQVVCTSNAIIRDVKGRFGELSQPNLNNVIHQYSRQSVDGTFKIDVGGHL